MQTKIKVIKSHSHNPYENLALEEYLLENVEDDEVILYLWQNLNTIVIGKNQNPWKECQVSLIENDNILIARRLSGGGAVFHDLGNLNFTFIMKEDLYNLEKQLEVIITSLQSLGINASFTGKNDITVDGKKFSGNAFYFNNGVSYHHGTILVNTNFNNLEKYLQVSKEKMNLKGITSTRSRVVNLIDLNPRLTIDIVSQAIVDSFTKLYGGPLEIIHHPPREILVDKIIKNESWDWIYGQTPDFDLKLEKYFDFGKLEILFLLEGSRIQEVNIYSDAVLTGVIDKLKSNLTGVKFNRNHILESLSSIIVETDKEKDMLMEIKNWFRSMEI
ncbi:MAG: lipoate--protein ligase [Epulopiscium sp.]|nr:lipoate--protein ligase [Candidatus Epulonipiscium sp.]